MHKIPYHTIPYHTIPYHTIPYHTIPYHTTPYQHLLWNTSKASCSRLMAASAETPASHVKHTKYKYQARICHPRIKKNWPPCCGGLCRHIFAVAPCGMSLSAPTLRLTSMSHESLTPTLNDVCEKHILNQSQTKQICRVDRLLLNI